MLSQDLDSPTPHAQLSCGKPSRKYREQKSRREQSSNSFHQQYNKLVKIEYLNFWNLTNTHMEGQVYTQIYLFPMRKISASPSCIITTARSALAEGSEKQLTVRRFTRQKQINLCIQERRHKTRRYRASHTFGFSTLHMQKQKTDKHAQYCKTLTQI